MRSIHVLAALALVTHVQSQVQCPKYPNGTCQDFKFAIEGDCEKYFACDLCQIEVAPCPPGEHFDAYEQKCDSKPWARCDPSAVVGTLFSVALENLGDVSGEIDIAYDKIIENFQHPFDPVTSTVLANSNGTFFFHLSAGLAPGQPLDIRLEGLPYEAGIYSNNTEHDYDSQSRDIIAPIAYGTTLKVSLQNESSIFANNTRLNIWAGFQLEEFMSSVVAFSASTSDVVSETGNIVFGEALVNEGDAYDNETGLFTAPSDGIYFFSFSALVGTEDRIECHFDSVSNGRLSYIFRSTRSEINAYDSISKSILVNLDAGEQLRMYLESGRVDGLIPNAVTFSGFQYEPKSQKQAWSVYGISSHDAGANPVPFEIVDINEGELFDVGTNNVVVNITGYYYVSVAVGSTTNSPVDVTLLCSTSTGDEDVFSIFQSMDIGQSLGADTISKSVIVHLNFDDRLSLKVNSGGAIFSDPQKLVSFSGLLIHDVELPLKNEPIVHNAIEKSSLESKKSRKYNKRERKLHNQIHKL